MSDLFNLFGEPVVEVDENELKEAKKEISKLRKEINYHSELYYTKDEPEISDYEFDMLMKRLKALETKFPMLITKSSPTRRVGGANKAGFS